jgi:NTE family protein
MPKRTALILAGAVAKGAFEAGALAVLSRHTDTIPIHRIVAASSGALNGSVYAAAVRAGAEAEVADRLVELWQHKADWHAVLKPNLIDIVTGKGVGTADRLLPLMREALQGLGFDAQHPVRLRLLLTVLRGELREIGGKPATTFEHVSDFADSAFDTEGGRDDVFAAALGSAAFPVLFAPVDVPGVGPTVDGGAVNNVPIKRAIEGGDAERIIVVSPEPLVMVAPGELRGVSLVSQLADILINERLFRDLNDAESVNGYLEKLDALTAEGVSPDVIRKVKAIFGWKPLEVVQIRPERALRGSAFSAFSDAHQMAEYVQTGRECAQAALEGPLRAMA